MRACLRRATGSNELHQTRLMLPQSLQTATEDHNHEDISEAEHY